MKELKLLVKWALSYDWSALRLDNKKQGPALASVISHYDSFFIHKKPAFYIIHLVHIQHGTCILPCKP